MLERLSPCVGACARLQTCVRVRSCARVGDIKCYGTQVRAVADGQAAEHGAQEKGVFANPGHARHVRVPLSMLSIL